MSFQSASWRKQVRPCLTRGLRPKQSESLTVQGRYVALVSSSYSRFTVQKQNDQWPHLFKGCTIPTCSRSALTTGGRGEPRSEGVPYHSEDRIEKMKNPPINKHLLWLQVLSPRWWWIRRPLQARAVQESSAVLYRALIQSSLIVALTATWSHISLPSTTLMYSYRRRHDDSVPRKKHPKTPEILLVAAECLPTQVNAKFHLLSIFRIPLTTRPDSCGSSHLHVEVIQPSLDVLFIMGKHSLRLPWPGWNVLLRLKAPVSPASPRAYRAQPLAPGPFSAAGPSHPHQKALGSP